MLVHVFKTNIISSIHVKRIGPLINTIDGIDKWNVDLHDCDKVLRVETLELTPDAIASVIQMAGYYCEELY